MISDTLPRPELDSVACSESPTVLIVDDDNVLADVLSSRLARQGFRTAIAPTGEEGVAKARSDVPALIVLDLQLPDIDGFSVCEQLADSPQTCSIPVIILSGMERPDMLRRCRAAGAQYFIRKPYDPNVMLILIRQAISEAEGWVDGE